MVIDWFYGNVSFSVTINVRLSVSVRVRDI